MVSYLSSVSMLFVFFSCELTPLKPLIIILFIKKIQRKLMFNECLEIR